MSGSPMINLLPLLISLSSLIYPLWSSAIYLTNVSPIPLLLTFMDLLSPTCENLLNINSWSSFDIPMPVSSTVISI